MRAYGIPLADDAEGRDSAAKNRLACAHTQMEAGTTSVGKSTFRPKDLELFHASKFQQRSTFRGYDKATVNPAHGELPRWNVKLSTIAKLGGYGTQYNELN